MITSLCEERPQATRQASARVAGLTVIGDRSHIVVSEDLAQYILKHYTPKRPYDAAVLAWARRLAVESRPTGDRDARTVVLRLVDLAVWLLHVGYALDWPVEDLLDDKVIRRYVEETGFSKGTQQTTISLYRRVRRAVTGERKEVFSGRTDVDSAVVPVTDAEVDALLRWVHGIDEQHDLHTDGLVLVSLIRGAGCTRPDLDQIDVASFRALDDGRLALDIDGEAARTVTVDERWTEPLSAAQARVGQGSPFDIDGRQRWGSACLDNLSRYFYRQRKNLDERTQRRLPGFINLNAYRAAWLLDRLQRCDRLDHILAEAGVSSAASLDRYLQFLPDHRAPRARTR